MRIDDEGEQPEGNEAGAALIADSAIFKASGKLEREVQQVRDRIGDAYSESADEIAAKIQSGAIKVVYKPDCK